MSAAYIVAAYRTAVAPRGGDLASFEVHELAAPVIRRLLEKVGVTPGDVDEVLFGNALYGGGNPARLAALDAGLPRECPASTLDSQCCAGLDAVIGAASRIAAGEADIVVAGGMESYSRAPIRMRRPTNGAGAPTPYDRPPFSPWPDRDPDMIEAAARLARDLGIQRVAQDAYAVESHRKAGVARPTLAREIVAIDSLQDDSFTRRLSPALCRRLPILAGSDKDGVTNATVAVEADCAAALLVVSEKALKALDLPGRPRRIAGAARRGGDPEQPALAAIDAARVLLDRMNIEASTLETCEIMEAFSVQAIAFIEAIGLAPDRINRSGGALARGHPIGASGAVLAVRLWHELQDAPDGAHGLAAIAAAGGLGSALLMTA